jgi:hypothetical protein
VTGPSGSTSKYQLPYPVSSDTTDVPRDVAALANRLELLMAKSSALSSLDGATVDGIYYAAPAATGNPLSQYAIVEHRTSSDGTSATQFVQSVTGSYQVAAFRAKTGATAGAGGTWGAWSYVGNLPGIARAGGSGDYPASGTGSTSSRNVWANLNVASAAATFVTPLKCRALIQYSAWLRIAPTNDTAQDVRVFPRIVVPGGTAYGRSDMAATTLTVPGNNGSELLVLGQDDAGAGVFTMSSTHANSFTFDFPAGTSTVTLQCYRSWPSGSTGGARVPYAKVQVTPLQYIP